MIIRSPTIPSAFIRLDSSVLSKSGDATKPRYADTRSLQTVQKNHNILLARRNKHAILTQSFMTSAGARGVGLEFANPLSSSSGDVLLSVPISLSDMCQAVVINIYAKMTGTEGTDDVYLYPVIHPSGDTPVFDDSFKVTINQDAETLFAVTIPNRPNKTLTFKKENVLTIFAQGGVRSGGAVSSGISLTATDKDYVQGIFDSDHTGRILLFAVPRQVSRYAANVSGAADRCWVDRPFSPDEVPAPGTTVDVYNARLLTLYSIAVYEKSISDFMNPNLSSI